jgi:predicted TIM-barrel fold metal-dependent hydrolase
MKEFEIIDAHIHLTQSVEEEVGYYPVPGRRDRDRWSNPRRLISYMDTFGISKMVFMILIPRQYRAPLFEKARLSELPQEQREKEGKKLSEQIAALTRKYNEWGCEVGRNNPRLLPCVGISPDLGSEKDIVKELELRVKQGAKGVKMHPGMYSFYPADERLLPMYEKCQELGIPVLADSGPWPHSHELVVFPLWFSMPKEKPQPAEPVNFAPVLEQFPRLKLVLAHLGSAWWDERVELALKYPNVLFDTSQGFSAPDRIPVVPHRSLAEEDAVRIFRKIGTKRILFGTDFPAIPPSPQMEQILRLDLTDDEKQMILAENAKRVYNIR